MSNSRTTRTQNTPDRTGDEGAIAAYLEDGDAFEDALCAFSSAYADQNEADYQVFLARHA